jgi:hypothetical protein
LAGTTGGPDAVIESVDIAREGHGICWDVPGGGGCLDGLYPDAGCHAGPAASGSPMSDLRPIRQVCDPLANASNLPITVVSRRIGVSCVAS